MCFFNSKKLWTYLENLSRLGYPWWVSDSGFAACAFWSNVVKVYPLNIAAARRGFRNVYLSVRPSVRPSVRLFVRPFVRPSRFWPHLTCGAYIKSHIGWQFSRISAKTVRCHACIHRNLMSFPDTFKHTYVQGFTPVGRLPSFYCALARAHEHLAYYNIIKSFRASPLHCLLWSKYSRAQNRETTKKNFMHNVNFDWLIKIIIGHK